ncbi:MAG: peptidoglycan-binding protein, partial [Candidatus Omnitrophica bacterium]|nr:peptidoglycan-binding protein [Candidatus Omnitrophota bacterium]
MKKRWLKKAGLFLMIIYVFILIGCATLSKRSTQIQELRNQIQGLEAELNRKEQEIAYLKSLLEEREKTRLTKIFSLETKSRPSVRQIQIALKNAGYNPGEIDGKMGKQTRQAIRAFQKANGLVVDGKV